MSRGFSCPECGHGNSRVVDCRPREIGPNGHSIEAFRRRRQCSNCEERYTTFELLAGQVRKLERMLDMMAVLNNGVNGHD